MSLKKLEIFGFKSFADKTTLDFKDGITAIVGPNGSGKSNISDAVRWVLGEQSIKSLRGSRMEDVIFSGTERRKSLGLAEVSLTVDNKSGLFPIEYSEISVTRRLYRSGESEYFINKSPCRLKDIQDLFSDTGLGKEGYSIIGQGQIDRIISSSPQERRLFVEEAAGIVKFKNRKIESQRKLDKTQDNLYRIGDIIVELEKQMPSLKRQSEKATQYFDLRETLKKIELNLFVHRVDEIKGELKGFEEDLEHMEDSKRGKSEAIACKEESYEKLRSEVDGIDEKLNGLNQENLDLSETHQKRNTQIQVSQIKIENNRERLESLQNSREEMEGMGKSLKEKLWVVEENTLSVETELKVQREELASLQAEKVQREEQMKSQQSVYLEKKDTLDRLNGEILKCTSEIALLENKENYAKENLENVQSQIDDLKGRTEALRERQREKTRKQNTLLEQIEALQSEDSEKRTDLKKREEQSRTLAKTLKYEESQYNKLHSKYSLMKDNEDFLGYHHSVKALLKEKRKNPFLSQHLHDVVGNIIDVPKKYALAVETALGGSVNHLITEDEHAAHECIKLLNKNKWGRATFLPLTIIKGHVLKVDEQIQNLDGYLDVASNLVSYDKTYTQIVYNLLGRVIIVENMDAAKIISKGTHYKYKIVTLNGEIFFPGGSIVGGTQKNNSGSIIQRKQEVKDLESAVKQSKEKIDQLEANQEQLSKVVKEKSDELTVIEKDLNQRQMEEKLVSQEGEQLDGQMKGDRSRMSSLTSQNETISAQWKALASEREVEKAKLATLQSEAEDLTNVEDFRVDDTEQRELSKIDEQILAINRSIAKGEERRNYYLTQKKDFTATSEENARKQSLNQKEMDRLIAENEKLQGQIKATKDQMTEFEQHRAQMNEELNTYAEEKRGKNVKIDELQDDIKELNRQNVLINDSYNKMANKIENKNAELERLEKNIYEDYQANYAMATSYRYHVENMQKETKTAKAYKTELKNLGSINVDAVEQYKEVKERYDFLTKQRDDLVHAKESLHEIIDEISENMEVQFVEQFKRINEAFARTFADLFDGGTAKLTLEDADHIMESGVDIEVQPPGKKIKNISLLSGGEKALTAIALLFAIINIKPTPFCILDEIDAALDDSNVDRFSKYLHKTSKGNQFINITHRKGTMEIADRLYGISMNQDGVTQIVSVEMNELLEDEVKAHG